MKKRFITFAGAVGLLAGLANLCAASAHAQVASSVAVRNVDEKGRSPYMQFQAHPCPGRGNTVCDVIFPPVPAGKRLVLEHVSSSILFANNGVRIAGLLAPVEIFFFFPVHPSSPTPSKDPIFLVNEFTLAYFEAGQSPIFHLVVNNGADTPLVTSTMSGYLVDLVQ